MITQRLKIDGQNIVKDDGSLFPAWGHNYDNLNILDAGVYGDIIENVWTNNLYAKGGIFTITNVAWSHVVGEPAFTYDVTLTLAEPLSADTFASTDKITIAGTSLTGTIYEIFGGATVSFNIDGASTDPNVNRTAVSINTSNNTITFQQIFNNFVVPGNVAVTNGIVGIGSIELDLAILKNIAKSKIIRICLQLDQFMLDDNGYQAALNAASRLGDENADPNATNNVVFNTDPLAVNKNQLTNLYNFLDLAAKYDLYVIVNGANSWVGGNQPDWLAWSIDKDRWDAQASFWSKVAEKIGTHPALAWYSLINEPVDQIDDFLISDYTLNSDGTMSVTAISTNQVAIPDDKNGQAGYAIMTSPTGDQAELLHYQYLTYYVFPSGGTSVKIEGITRDSYGNYDGNIAEENLVNSYVSLINKAKDVNDLKIQTTAGSTTATINLTSNAKPFKSSTSSSYSASFGFLGDSATIGDGLSTPSQRFSTLLLSSVSTSLTEYNFGVAQSILSSNAVNGTTPTGYGQVLKNYPNGNIHRLNSVNFGKEDFKLYGISKGYNENFFIQSLKVVLSRLCSRTVTEFSNLSGFTTVDSTVSNAAYSASGGSYQRYAPSGGTGSKTITFTTPSNFVAGETVAIGFMVEYGAQASATVTINGNVYKQGLTSGVDVYKPSSNSSGNYSALPVVKRLNNLPSGVNTITITLDVNATSACLDYWQIESSSSAPIILNSIDNNLPSTIPGFSSGEISSYGNPVVNWNQKIVNLIYSEFFDRNIFYFDANTILDASTDYDVSNNLNSSGHSKITASYKDIFAKNNLLPNYGVSISGTTYTYTTSDFHGLRKGDQVVISGALPSSLNGTFTITSVPASNQFTVTGTAFTGIPSAETATYSGQFLKTNTTYSINNDYIPQSKKIAFTTGSSITGTNNLYTVTLSSSDGVSTSPDFQPCSIVNNTQWVGASIFNSDRHYNPYISITPRGSTNFTVIRNWITRMKSAIQDIGNDKNTPISVPTTSFYGNASEFEKGFGPSNIGDLVDLFSPHQYPYSYKSTNELSNNLRTFNDYEKPSILEEGAIPYSGTTRQTTNYLLKSKRHLAGALNNYQGYYNLGIHGWVPWTTDLYKYQYVFDSLSPFMADAPADSPESLTIHSAYDGPSDFPDKNVNKPEVIGNRYLVPAEDLFSYTFSFYKADTLSPSNESSITVDGSYTAQTQLVKTGSTLPQLSTIWFDGTDNIGLLFMNLNGFYKSSNQDILYVKPVANFKRGNAMVFRNQRPTTATQSGSTWSIYPSGSDFVAAVNGTGTTTLSTAITSTAGSISFTVADASAFATSGVVLIDDEYIIYTRSGNVLTATSTGRGYNNTIPATHDASTLAKTVLVRGITPLGTTVVRNSLSNSSSQYMDWTLSSSSFPSGRSLYQIDVWVCLFTGYSDRATRVTTSAATLTTSGVLTFSSSSAIANFGVGAFLADDAGVIDPGVYVLSKSGATLTMTKDGTNVWKPSSNIHTGSYINATNAPLTAKVQLYDSTRNVYFNYKTINYKGSWFNPNITGTDSSGRQGLGSSATPTYPRITYSLGDLVSYKQDDGVYRVYRSLRDDNRFSIPTAAPYTSNTYWQLMTTCDTRPTDFVWIKMSLYKDSTTNTWKDVDTDETISSSGFFPPSNLRVSVSNATPSSYTRPSTKYISVATVYSDQFTDGNIDATDATVLETTLYKSGPAGVQSNTKISFKNNTNTQWVTSDNSVGQQNTGQFDQSALDGPMYLSIITPPASENTLHTKSYMSINTNNLNVNTAYVEVKMKETLARKGNPIVSM